MTSPGCPLATSHLRIVPSAEPLHSIGLRRAISRHVTRLVWPATNARLRTDRPVRSVGIRHLITIKPTIKQTYNQSPSDGSKEQSRHSAGWEITVNINLQTALRPHYIVVVVVVLAA